MKAWLGFLTFSLAAIPCAQEPEDEDEKVIPIKWNSLSVGFSTWQATGSRVQLRRHARPSEGLTLRELSFITPDGANRPYSAFSWRGVPNEDVFAEGHIILDKGKTRVKISQQAHGYQNDGPLPPLPSENRVTTASVERSITSDLAVYATYRADERDQRFSPYRDSRHSRSSAYTAGLSGNLLGGNAEVLIQTRRYTDDSSLQPDTFQRRVEGRYAVELGPALFLEGAAGMTKIEQSGREDSTVRSFALAADFSITPQTTFYFAHGREDFDLSGVLSATLQRRIQTSYRIVQRWSGWTLQVGYRAKEVDRKRKGSVTDQPRWTTYDARIVGRLSGVRVSLRGSWEGYRGSPEFQLTKPGRTIWDDRTLGQVKVDGGNGRFAGYGSLTYRRQQNHKTDIAIGQRSLALGGSFVFFDSLSAFAELANDSYQVRGPSSANTSFDSDFPSATIYAFGIDWSIRDGQTLSAVLNRYSSRSQRGSQLTIQYQRRLTADDSLELFFAPWRHEDRLTGTHDNSVSFFGIALTRRF